MLIFSFCWDSEKAVIKVDYGNLEAAKASGRSSFYSRRLSIPIITTVQSTLLCRHLEITPLVQKDLSETASAVKEPRKASLTHTSRKASWYQADQLSRDQFQDALVSPASGREQCLVHFVFTNTSEQTIELNLERKKPGVLRMVMVRGLKTATEHDRSCATGTEIKGSLPLIVRRLVAPKASER